MILVLNKRIVTSDNITYEIMHNSHKEVVSYTDLCQLINSIPAKERNCKIVNGKISLKAGCGNLATEEVKVKNNANTDKELDNNYVNIIPHLLKPETKKYLHETAVRFNVLGLSAFKKYLSLLELDGVQKYDLNTGAIQTKYGITGYENLSSGIKCLLVAMLYADKHPGYKVNVS
jgi:hypothetical protein